MKGELANSIPDKLQEGRSYHVSWAHNGCVWRLIKLNDNGTCLLRTKATNKEIAVKQSDLRNTREYHEKQLNPTPHDHK